MPDLDVSSAEGFELGRPALVCRWRLASNTLPLCNRHLRALGQRRVGGAFVPRELVSWAKQHIEWTLVDGSAENPDGVLMLVIDEKGRAAMSVGPYEDLGEPSLAALVTRATASAEEAATTGVAPETLWVAMDGVLYWNAETTHKRSGIASLLEDLAHTMGYSVVRRPDLIEEVSANVIRPDEAFLVSDEHGVVAARGMGGERSEWLAASYAKLLEQADK